MNRWRSGPPNYEQREWLQSVGWYVMFLWLLAMVILIALSDSLFPRFS